MIMWMYIHTLLNPYTISEDIICDYVYCITSWKWVEWWYNVIPYFPSLSSWRYMHKPIYSVRVISTKNVHITICQPKEVAKLISITTSHMERKIFLICLILVSIQYPCILRNWTQWLWRFPYPCWFFTDHLINVYQT